MLGTFMVGMLVVCSLILLAAWVIDGIRAAIETTRGRSVPRDRKSARLA